MSRRVAAGQGSGWDVVLVDGADGPAFDGIARFHGEQYEESSGPQVSAAELRWKLGTGNPAGTGIAATAVHNGELVGMVTATLKRGRLGDEPVTIAEMGDVYVRAAAQRLGPAVTPLPGTAMDDAVNRSVFARMALELTAALEARGVGLVFGTPNERALPGWVKRIGYARLDHLSLRSWHRPASGLFRRRVPALLADVMSAGLGIVAHPARPMRLRGLELGPLDAMDDLDVLWSACSPRGGVELVQDARYFDHRFSQHPDGSYELWALRRRGELVGLFVGRSLRRPNGNTTYCIADWLVADGACSELAAVIAAIAGRRSSDPDTVSLWTDGTLLSGRTMHRLGFVRPRTIPVVVAPTVQGAAVLDHRLSWDMRMGWTDNV